MQSFNPNWGTTNHRIQALTSTKPEWLHLGKDMWIYIFLMLSKDDIIVCTHVCSTFKKLIRNRNGTFFDLDQWWSMNLLKRISDKPVLNKVPQIQPTLISTQPKVAEYQEGVVTGVPQACRQSRVEATHQLLWKTNCPKGRNRSHHQTKPCHRPRFSEKYLDHYLDLINISWSYCKECGDQILDDLRTDQWYHQSELCESCYSYNKYDYYSDSSDYYSDSDYN
jgi:hypothetical protein